MSAAKRRRQAINRREAVAVLEERWDHRLGRIPRGAIAVMVCPCGTRMWLREGATDEDWERFREAEAAHDYCDETEEVSA